ncbi:MAG: helix-turn-helix domain-containing protein [Pseudomonadota bacterium]|jgi:excisionase family DNA binding protein
MANLQNYLLIKDAAQFLGVSQGTLRNWGRGGKITTHRNPLNGYRLFRRSDLETLLKLIERPWNPRAGR